MEPKTPEGRVGVIIGRFQTPRLHDGHKTLIQEVEKRHCGQVVILLGVAPTRNRKNPLDFEMRRRMILGAFPYITVLPLPDVRDDSVWTARADSILDATYPLMTKVIYGSRDSALACYQKNGGRWPVVEMEGAAELNATKLREEASRRPIAEEAFRAGVIYAVYNQYNRVYPTVDFALTRRNYNRNQPADEYQPAAVDVLLAKKPGEKNWRFPGGFIDPSDQSAEHAVVREAREETGVVLYPATVKYIGSAPINDWRLKDPGRDIVHTFFYEADVTDQPVRAGDDISEVAWFPVENLPPLVEEHLPLKEIVENRYQNHLEAKRVRDTLRQKEIEAQ